MKLNVKPIPLKLRQKKVEVNIDCASQMTMLLNCYVENDFQDAQCRQALKGLVECMKTTKKQGPPPKSTVNYHLQKMIVQEKKKSSA